MTRDEILNMPEGRELDALVAEKVMGCDTKQFIWKRYGKPDAIQDCEYGGPCNYSTDIAAAWQVVEKMEHDDWWWEAANVVPNSDPIVYEFKWTHRGVIKAFYACEDTIPLAICRAALLAVMESGE